MITRDGKILTAQAVQGLELEEDAVVRVPFSWRRLENFDLFKPGSIRKVPGPALFNNNLYDSPIVAIKAYRALPSDSALILGLSQNGTLYDIETGAIVDSLGLDVGYPFVTLMAGQLVYDPLDPDSVKTVQYLITT